MDASRRSSRSSLRAALRPAWIVCAFLALLLLARLTLLAAYHREFAGLGAAGAAAAFLHGLRLDLSITARFLAPALLALALPFRWAGARSWRLAWSRVALAELLAALALVVGDLVYFGLTGRHVGAELFGLENDLDIVLAVALADHLPVLGLYLALAGAAVLGWRRLERWDARRSEGARAPLWLAPILVAGVVLAARGGLQGKPIGIATAYASGSLQQGLLALNAPYGLYHSRKVKRVTLGKRLPPEEALALVRAQVVSPGEVLVDPERLPLQRRRPAPPGTERHNVVILLLESWDARYVDALRVRRGEPPLGATPSFDALAARGLLFTRFHAAGQYSMNGLTALLAGMPSLSNSTTLSRGLEQSELSYLGHLSRAQGWSSHFLQGSKRTSFHLDAVAPMAGFERYSGMEDILQRSSGGSMETWGAWDGALLEELQRQDLEATPPFLALAFSASTHEPFQTPAGFEPRFAPGIEHADYLDCLAYADECLGRYVEGAEAAGYLDDTLLVVLADHAARLPGAAARPLAAQLEIPCAIVGPGVAPGTFDEVASQVDLLPTLAGLAGWTGDHAALGRDLLAGDLPADHGALGAIGDLIVRVERNGWIAHDRTRIVEAVARQEGFDPAATERRLLATLQVAQDLLGANRLFDADAARGAPGR